MKRLKRIAAALLLASICFACISTTAYAADGRITFTDLETSVGNTFTVRCKVNSSGDNIGNVTLKMSYDTSYLQFMSGDGVTQATAGQLEYQGTGDGDELQFEMQFQALQEGETRMELDEAEVSTEDGENMDCTLGYSDVKIGEGDPSKIETPATGPEVEVEGETYTLSESFSDVDVPNGFSTGTISYDGESYQGAVFNEGDMKLGYLVSSDDTGKFYVYNESTSEFSPFEYVTLNENSYIILLQEDETLSIPSRYTKQKLTFNGHEYPVWQDTENTDYYLIYALNQDGDKVIYRYDSVDGTYQRYLNEDVGTDDTKDTESTSSGLFGNISDYLKNHIDYFLIGAGMLLVLGVVFIVILGVKLHNRNNELDEVYDQLDEFTEPKVKASSGSRLPKSKAMERTQTEKSDEDDYYEEDDYEDDLFDEDDRYEDMEELRFQNILSEKTNGAESRSEAYDEYENLDLDQTGDMPVSKKANKKKKKDKNKDDFDIEIIDL